MQIAVILVSVGVALFIITKAVSDLTNKLFLVYRNTQLQNEFLVNQALILEKALQVFDRVSKDIKSDRHPVYKIYKKRYTSHRDNPKLKIRIASSRGFSR
jgi:hypothetical protein